MGARLRMCEISTKTTTEELAKLAAPFRENGTVTTRNANSE